VPANPGGMAIHWYCPCHRRVNEVYGWAWGGGAFAIIRWSCQFVSLVGLGQLPDPLVSLGRAMGICVHLGIESLEILYDDA